MEDPSPKKLVHGSGNFFGATPGVAPSNLQIQSNWVDLVTKNANMNKEVRMNKVHHQMSGTSGGGVDGGEPHLTTNGEVSIASEFNYDACKYNEAPPVARPLEVTPAQNNHFVYHSPYKNAAGVKRSLD